MCEWKPISEPPTTSKEGASVRVLGVIKGGHHVFASYTPYYLGHADEAKMLWTCEHFGWAEKPTHWRPLTQPSH